MFKTIKGLVVDATADGTSVTIDGREVDAKVGEDAVQAKIKVDSRSSESRPNKQKAAPLMLGSGLLFVQP